MEQDEYGRLLAFFTTDDRLEDFLKEAKRRRDLDKIDEKFRRDLQKVINGEDLTDD